MQLHLSPAEGALAMYTHCRNSGVEEVFVCIRVYELKILPTWLCVMCACMCMTVWEFQYAVLFVCVWLLLCVCVCVKGRSEFLEPVQHSNTVTFGRFSQQSREKGREREWLLYARCQLVSMTIITITSFLFLFSSLHAWSVWIHVCVQFILISSNVKLGI